MRLVVELRSPNRLVLPRNAPMLDVELVVGTFDEIDTSPEASVVLVLLPPLEEPLPELLEVRELLEELLADEELLLEEELPDDEPPLLRLRLLPRKLAPSPRPRN